MKKKYSIVGTIKECLNLSNNVMIYNDLRKRNRSRLVFGRNIKITKINYEPSSNDLQILNDMVFDRFGLKIEKSFKQFMITRSGTRSDNSDGYRLHYNFSK